MARHLRRPRPCAECPRSLHQPRLRPRHRGRVLPHPAQAQPAGPCAEGPGRPRMIPTTTVTPQKPSHRGIRRYGPPSPSRCERRVGPANPTDARPPVQERSCIAPRSRSTTVPRPAPPAWVTTPTRHVRGAALGGPMLLNTPGPILLKTDTVREFAAIRNWTRFHNPKNVAEAIVVEAAELLECFQWRTDDSCLSQSLDDTTRLAIESELADVVIYALNLANALDVDATEVVQAKLEKNATRYPAPFARE